MSTAFVVGAGPNGLAAAVTLARAGVEVTVLEAADEIGGGTRSSEAILPGLLHDHCSAIHPMAVGSPFLTGLGLDRYGLRWRLPEIDCVHPLDGGAAGVLHRSVEPRPPPASAPTAGAGEAVRRAARRRSTRSPTTSCGPLLRLPRPPADARPVRRATVLPAVSSSRRLFRTERGAGAVRRRCRTRLPAVCTTPMTSAIGLGIITAGHRHGWAVAAGGSQRITDAMAALLDELGGKIETGVRVRAAHAAPAART